MCYESVYARVSVSAYVLNIAIKHAVRWHGPSSVVSGSMEHVDTKVKFTCAAMLIPRMELYAS